MTTLAKRAALGTLFVLAGVAIPARAALIPIVNLSQLTAPDGSSVTGLGPLSLTNGSTNGFTWSGVGASVLTVGSNSRISLAGTFACVTASCFNETFSLSFYFGPVQPGYTANVSLTGNTTALSTVVSLSANRPAGSLGQVTGNSNISSVFALQSLPIAIGGGNFSGTMTFTINQMLTGTVTIPPGATGDLLFTSSSVPEPGTIAIGAACLLLLVYVKTLRK